MSFFTELKRRNVFKVGVAYIIVGWLLIQVVSIVVPSYKAPDWVMPICITLISIGFPLALIIAWAFELTPEGIKRTKKNELVANEHVAKEIREQSIAVLPFADLSPDKDQEYFSDGISEELMNQLAHLKGLHVAGRTSSFYFKGKNEDFHVIGDKLGVAHILEGSVRKAGNQVRITAQLIKVSDGYHLWSETYDRELDDIFAIQEETAKAVANALSITLGVGKADLGVGGTSNFAAYDAYLSSKSLRYQTGRENLIQAIKLLEQAVTLDPEFAIAWCELSFCYEYAMVGPISEQASEFNRKHEEAAKRAMKIAPGISGALLADMRLQVNHREWTAAEQSGRNALDLKPTGVEENYNYSNFLMHVGRSREATEYAHRAARADPLALQPTAWLGLSYEINGDFDEALRAYMQAEGLIGDHAQINVLILVYAMGVNDKELLDEYLQKTLDNDLLPPNNRSLTWSMSKYLETPERALAELRNFFRNPAYDNPTTRRYIAYWASYFGDYELALQANRSIVTPAVIWKPVHKNMRKHVGFKELVSELGLVDYWRTTNNWGEFCHPVGENDFECN